MATRGENNTGAAKLGTHPGPKDAQTKSDRRRGPCPGHPNALLHTHASPHGAAHAHALPTPQSRTLLTIAPSAKALRALAASHRGPGAPRHGRGGHPLATTRAPKHSALLARAREAASPPARAPLRARGRMLRDEVRPGRQAHGPRTTTPTRTTALSALKTSALHTHLRIATAPSRPRFQAQKAGLKQGPPGGRRFWTKKA